MTKRIALPLIVAACIIASACFSKLSARDEAPSNWRDLEKRYAEANLELAQFAWTWLKPKTNPSPAPLPNKP
jgi:hypothetical protein